MSALGILPLGIFDVFARVGYFWWDADIRSQLGGDGDRDSNRGSDLTYGIGGALWLGQLSIRAEIEMFDVSDAENVFLYSAGLAYTFL